MNTYTSNSFYSTIIQRAVNAPPFGVTWYVYLYNYSTAQWETITSGTDDAVGIDSGWDIFEEYLSSCSGNIPKIYSKQLKVYTSSGWKVVTSTYGKEKKTLLHCGASNYTPTWVFQYDYWTLDPLY